jgi:DNA-binding MarR family transcriptional regulator
MNINGPDEISSEFGRLFLRLHRLMDRRMAEEGASLAATKLLLLLERQGPKRATDIADFFGQAPRTVTEAIDGLERKGLVEREPDPLDRRAKRISLTPAGATALQATQPLRLALIERVFGVLSGEEQAQLSALLGKLGQALEEAERG